MITLAAFDMAGTTINDGGAVYRALERAVTETGVPVAAADLQTWMGAEKRAAITALIELGGGDPRHPADKVEAAYQRFRAILSELYAEVPPTPIEGVADTIAQLRAAGVSVALTTGFSRDIATGILAEIGWGVASEGADTPMVDGLVCGDEVAAGRPAPYMIHRAMEQTGTVSTGTVLVAGDTVVDVRAGANSGAAVTIGVLTGELVREDFAGEPATELLGSVAEIPAYLSEHGLWP